MDEVSAELELIWSWISTEDETWLCWPSLRERFELAFDCKVVAGE